MKTLSISALRSFALVAFCSMLVGLAAPGTASAQLTALGATPTLGATDLNAIAFDDVNGVYLHVGSRGRLMGRFVNDSGVTVGGQFDISSGLPGASYASWMGAAYSTGSSAGVFLVAYASEISNNRCKNVFGQLVRFNGSGGELVGTAFRLSSAPLCQSFQEVDGVTFNPVNNQFFVVWSDSRNGWDVYGRVVNADGTLPGGEINLTADPRYQGQASIAHDWNTNTYVVAYIAEPGSVGTYARVLDATGAPITGPLQLSIGGLQGIPCSMYLPERSAFLVLWHEERVKGDSQILGRLVQPDGVLAGATYPVLTTSVGDFGPDGRYNWISRNVLVVGQHDSGRVVGELLDASGVPLSRWTPLSTVVPRTGSWLPQVAVGANGQFGVSYVVDQALGYVERFAAVAASTPGPSYGGVPPAPPVPDPTAIDFTAAVNGSEYFAEGVATADSYAFSTYYQIENPNDVDASVRMYFAKQSTDGTVTLKERTATAKANGRTTIDLRNQVGNGPWSAVFQSLTPNAPIVTQQSVYWGPDWEGSTSETGVREPSPVWLFAEGSRGAGDYFSNYFLLFNPNAQALTVYGDYYGPGATTPIRKQYTVPAFSRYTIFANGEIPDLANKDFSTKFTAADGVSPFVAQRAMYWGQNWVGGHSSNGATAANATWLFAEGAAAPNFDTYFTLLNPNDFAVEVRVTYLTESSGPVVRSQNVSLPANSRGTVFANGDLGNVGAFGTRFDVVGGHGIIVERSVYWGSGFPNWVEGTNDVGVNGPATTWAVPEGSDAGTFDTYTLVVNPNDFPVQIMVQFYLEGGGRITIASPVTIAANSRLTIGMNEPAAKLPLNAGDALLLKGKAFSTRIGSLTSNGPIIVESAVYRNWTAATRWRAGASAFGVPSNVPIQ